MVNWSRMDSELADYFRSHSAKSTDEAAAKIASMYNDAVQTAELQNGNKLLAFNASAFESALADAFRSMMKGSPNRPSTFVPMANAIVAAWSQTQFDSNPPFSGLEQPSTGVVVVSGGDASGLTDGLYRAFNAKEEQRVVDTLRSAFMGHLATVAGTYTGTKTVDKAQQEQPPIDWVGVI